MPRASGRLLLHLSVIGFFLVVAIGMTWPVAAHINTRLAGYAADNYLFVWTPWVFRQEVLSGASPLHTTRIYYPGGISLALHAMVATKSVPALALLAFLSPVTTFNVLVLASVTLCGYATWLLVRDLTGDSCAAVVSGLVFAFSPVLLAHATAGHLDYVSAEGIPFFVFFSRRAVKGNRWTDAVWAGLAMAYTGLSNWTYLLFLVMLWAMYAAHRLVKAKIARFGWLELRQQQIIAVVAFVGSAPLLLPALRASLTSSYDLTRYVGGSALYVSDLLGFVTPSPDHALVGRLVSPVLRLFTGGRFEGTVYLGLSVVILAGIGYRQAGRREGTYWLVAGLLFALLSLGPGLHVMGRYQFPNLAWLRMGSVAERLGVPMRPEWVRMFDAAPMIPLPGAVLQILPVFKWMRAPSRFVVVVMLALAVLAGHGIARVRNHLRGRRWLGLSAPAAATVVLGVVVLLEFFIIPFPTTPASKHPFHDELVSDTGDFAILELPIEPFGLLPQYWQTSHGKRLVYGHISRVPEERFDYLDHVESEIYQPTGYFADVDIRYLILHEDRLATLDPGEAQTLVDALETNFERLLSEENLRVYCGYGDCSAP